MSVSYGVYRRRRARRWVRHGRRAPHAGGCADIRAGDAITAEAVTSRTFRNVPAAWLGGEASMPRACCRRACDRYPGGNQLSSFVTGMGGDRLGRAESGLAGGDAHGGRGDRNITARHGAHRVCGGASAGVPRDGVQRARRCGGRRSRRAERFRLRHGGSVARGG
ncbi:MAG: hypothetical protein ACLTMP_01855 [Eggerthella lenta]